MPEWFQPMRLVDGVTAFTTSRGCDYDKANPYAGFNTCHYVGDDPVHVARSRTMLARHLGVVTDDVIVPRQTHSTNVGIADHQHRFFDNTDALVTATAGIVIGVNTADCVPVLLADPNAKVVGAAHAGWRGAVGGIVKATIAAMQTLGARPENIHTAMGPCICQECFEVGEEVACLFPQSVIDRSHAKPHVDLSGYVAEQLRASGVHHIALPRACTKCQCHRYPSARVHGINTTRLFTGIMLK